MTRRSPEETKWVKDSEDFLSEIFAERPSLDMDKKLQDLLYAKNVQGLRFARHLWGLAYRIRPWGRILDDASKPEPLWRFDYEKLIWVETT